MRRGVTSYAFFAAIAVLAVVASTYSLAAYLHGCDCRSLNRTVEEQDQTINELQRDKDRLKNTVSILIEQRKNLNQTVEELNVTVSEMKKQDVYANEYFLWKVFWKHVLDKNVGVHILAVLQLTLSASLFGLSGIFSIFGRVGLLGGLSRGMRIVLFYLGILSSLGLFEIVARGLQDLLQLTG